MELGQIKPIYLSDLTNYNHILKQRNTYLKSAQTIDETFLLVLDDQLVDYGCRVMNHRLDFIKKTRIFLAVRNILNFLIRLKSCQYLINLLSRQLTKKTYPNLSKLL